MFFIHIMSYLGFRGSPPKRLEVLGGSRLFFSSSSEVNHFKLLFCKRSILSILVIQVSQEVDVFIFSTFQFPNVRFVRKFLETLWQVLKITEHTSLRLFEVSERKKLNKAQNTPKFDESLKIKISIKKFMFLEF